MRRQSVLLSLCAALSLGTAAWAKAPAPKAIHYEVTLKSVSFGQMGTRKMWIKGNNMRWESKSGQLLLRLVKNKQGVFLMHPWRNNAARYPAGTDRGNPAVLFPGPTDSPAVFLKAVKATKSGTETVEKQLCNKYSFRDPASGRDCQLWIGTRTGKPVKLFVKGQHGKTDPVTAIYTRFELGGNIPNSLFELPKGCAIRQMPAPKLASKPAPKKPNRESI